MTTQSVKENESNKLALRENDDSLALAGIETSSTAVAAIAKAEVEARCVMAMKNRRSWPEVREEIKAECSRPEFANNKSVIYAKPIGGSTVEGLGIRFVEAALRAMKNVEANSSILFESETQRIVRVKVTDLEANITHYKDVMVTKTVERKQPREGKFIGTPRKNTKGDFVYTVTATDDEVEVKEASMVSKAMRTQGLRIIPGDLQDECKSLIKAVRRGEAKGDMKGAISKVADAYAGLGIKVAMLEAYLEHPLDQCTPDDIVDLRNLYPTLKDKEITWKEVMQSKDAILEEDDDDAAKETAKKGVEGAKARAAATDKGETVAVPNNKPKVEPEKAAEKPKAAAKPKAEPKPAPEPDPEPVEEAEEAEEAEAVGNLQETYTGSEAEGDDDFPPEEEEEEVKEEEPKGPIVRGRQFPHVFTLRGDEKQSPALLATLTAKAKELGQTPAKLGPHFLKTTTDTLNDGGLESLILVLQDAIDNKAKKK